MSRAQPSLTRSSYWLVAAAVFAVAVAKFTGVI